MLWSGMVLHDASHSVPHRFSTSWRLGNSSFKTIIALWLWCVYLRGGGWCTKYTSVCWIKLNVRLGRSAMIFNNYFWWCFDSCPCLPCQWSRRGCTQPHCCKTNRRYQLYQWCLCASSLLLATDYIFSTPSYWSKPSTRCCAWVLLLCYVQWMKCG